MGGTSVQLLGVEQGNGTTLSQSYNNASVTTDPVSRKWYEWFVQNKPLLYLEIQIH